MNFIVQINTHQILKDSSSQKIIFRRVSKIATKKTISFVMTVSPSVCPHEKLYSHWTNFQEIWYLKIFGKSADKTEVSVISDRNNGYFIWVLISPQPDLLPDLAGRNRQCRWKQGSVHVLNCKSFLVTEVERKHVRRRASLVAVPCFLPGRVKDLSVPRYTKNYVHI